MFIITKLNNVVPRHCVNKFSEDRDHVGLSGATITHKLGECEI